MIPARQPAFWRVVRDGVAGRMYLSEGATWTQGVALSERFSSISHAIRVTERLPGECRVVPVYVTVRRVQRGHDFAWAFRQSKAGKEVRVLQDNGVWRNCKTLEALVLVEAILKLSNAWQLGAQL